MYRTIEIFYKSLEVDPMTLEMIKDDCISKSNQTLFSNLYKYKHVIHDEIYILEKRMEKKLNNL